MPMLIQVIKWCILNFEELYLPSWFAAEFWNLLEKNSPQAGRCLLWPTGKPLAVWVSLTLWFPLTACFGLISKISGQSASLWSKHRGDFWMGHERNRPAWQCLLLLFLSLQSKKSFGLGGQYIFFLLFATKTTVNSGSTNNYFTSYSWVFFTVFIPYSQGCTTWE